MRITETTAGVFAVAPTPFRPDGGVDDASLDRMVDAYESAGCAGLTILGVMGEAPKLEQGEALSIVTRVIRRSRIPVVVGVSAPGFAAMRRLARSAIEDGAAGVMIAPLPTLRTDDQIAAYFEQAVAAIGADIPVAVQDYPLSTSVLMPPALIRRIVEALPSCVMLKHEDWPGLDKISALRTYEAEGSMRRTSILCGNGGLFLDLELARGADGAMTGYAFPEMLVDIVALARGGERERLHDLFDAHLPLLRYEQQQGLGLAVRKHLLRRRGFIAHETQRQPFGGLTDAAKADVELLLTRLAAKDPRAALPLR